MFRHSYVASTLFNGDVCHKKCSLDSDVQVVQQSTCLTGPKCDTRRLILFTSIMAVVMVLMALQSSEYNIIHFDEDYDTSNNHTIRAPNELVGDSGDATSQARSNGVIFLTVAISAVCFVFMAGLIRSMLSIDLR